MDALAEELLLQIFGGIEDAATLMALPLVCRRWRRVAADPRAWAGVRLTVTVGPLAAAGTLLQVDEPDAQALRRAPALRALALQRGSPVVPAVQLEAALPQCRAPLSELRLGVPPAAAPGELWLDYSPPMSITAPMIELLQRNSATLRVVSVMLRGQVAVKRQALEALAELPHLEDLTLECSSNFEGSLRVPGLRRLAFGAESASNDDVPLRQNRLLQDLLQAARATLREVRVGARLQLKPSTVKALAECQGVRVLAVNATGLTAVAGMPALRELNVEVRYPHEVSAGAAAVLASAPLDQLRCLRFTGGSAVKDPKVSRVVTALGAHRHLEEVSFYDGGGVLVPWLATLPALRRVDAHFRVPADEMQRCCNVFRSWRKTRAEVKGTVKLTAIPMSPKLFRF